MRNWIGEHRFLSLAGDWIPPAETFVAQQREGIDGTLIYRTGQKGQPFILESRVDAGDLQAAEDMYIEYLETMNAAEPVEVKRNDISSLELKVPFRCQILGVRKVRTHRHRAAAGGLNPPHLGFLICQWQLIAIAATDK